MFMSHYATEVCKCPDIWIFPLRVIPDSRSQTYNTDSINAIYFTKICKKKFNYFNFIYLNTCGKKYYIRF